MNTTKTLAGAAMAALLMAACGKLNMAESVRDLGFEVTAETAFSSDYLCCPSRWRAARRENTP